VKQMKAIARWMIRLKIIIVCLVHSSGCQVQENDQAPDKRPSPLLFDRTFPACVQSLAFVGNGKECVVADEDQISVLSCLDGSTITSDGTDGDGYNKCVSVGNETIWVSGKQLAARELDLRSLKMKSAIGDFDEEPSLSVLNSGGSRILVGVGRELIQHDKVTHKIVWETHTQFESIEVVHAVTDQWIAIGESALGPKYSVGLYSLSSGEKARTDFECKKKVRGIAFIRDGNRIAIGDESGNVDVYSVENGELSFNLNCDPRGVFAVSSSSDSRLLAVGCMRGAKIYSMNDQKLVASWNAHEWFVNCIAFSPDCKQLLSGSVDKHAKLWKVDLLIGENTYRDW
jgi:WD40 repeat protein